MELNDYQAQTRVFNDDIIGLGPYVSVIALNKCVGDFSNIIYNMINNQSRTTNDEQATLDDEQVKKLKIILGDILYVVARTADTVDTTLEDVANINIRKKYLTREYELKKTSMNKLKK